MRVIVAREIAHESMPLVLQPGLTRQRMLIRHITETGPSTFIMRLAVRILKLRCDRLKPLLRKSIQTMGGHLTALTFVLRANSLETVAGWILNMRAASAAVFSPLKIILRISTCCTGESFGRRPPIRPA